jgi:hypothetical protein
MHRRGQRGADQKSSDTCSMRGTCSGPMAAPFVLFSHHGILADSFVMLPDLHASHVTARTRQNLIGRLAAPDPPPPRT